MVIYGINAFDLSLPFLIEVPILLLGYFLGIVLLTDSFGNLKLLFKLFAGKQIDGNEDLNIYLSFLNKSIFGGLLFCLLIFWIMFATMMETIGNYILLLQRLTFLLIILTTIKFLFLNPIHYLYNRTFPK